MKQPTLSAMPIFTVSIVSGAVTVGRFPFRVFRSIESLKRFQNGIMSRIERIRNEDTYENTRFCDKNSEGDDYVCHFCGICHGICHSRKPLIFLSFLLYFLFL